MQTSNERLCKYAFLRPCLSCYYITQASVNESLRLIPLDINTMYRCKVKQHSPVYIVVVFYFSVNNFNSVIRELNANSYINIFVVYDDFNWPRIWTNGEFIWTVWKLGFINAWNFLTGLLIIFKEEKGCSASLWLWGFAFGCKGWTWRRYRRTQYYGEYMAPGGRAREEEKEEEETLNSESHALYISYNFVSD